MKIFDPKDHKGNKLALEKELRRHSSNQNVHVSLEEKESWNEKVTSEELDEAINSTKEEIEKEIASKVESMLHYKGSVETETDLPPAEECQVGDVYNVRESGANYAWSGTEWDKLSEDLSGFVTKDELKRVVEITDSKLATKVGINTFNTLQQYTQNLSETVAGLEESKADASEVDELFKKVTDLENNSATKKELENFQKEVNEKATKEDLENHVNDSVRHVTQEEKDAWNAKPSQEDLSSAKSELQDAINLKADKTELEKTKSALEKALETKADKTTLESVKAELQADIDKKVESALHYKGSKETFKELEAIQEPQIGDLYNVVESGANYAWSGSTWDKLSEDLSGFATKTELGDLKVSVDELRITKADRSAVNELSSQVEELKSSKVDKETYDAKVSEIEEKLGTLASDENLEALQEKVTTFQNEVEQNFQEVNEQLTSLEENKATKTELEEAQKTLQDNIDTKANKTDVDNSVSELQSEISGIDDRVKELEAIEVDQTYQPDSENAQSGTAVAEAIKSVEDKLSETDTSVDELKKQANATDARLTDVDNELKSAEADIATNQENITKLQEEQEALDSRLSTVESDLQTAQSDIQTNADNLQKHIDDKDVHFDDLEQKTKLLDDVSQAKTDISELQSNVTKNTTNIATNAENLKTHEADTNVHFTGEEEKTKLFADVKKAGEDIVSLDQRVSTNETNISELTTNLETLESTVSKNKSDIETSLENTKNQLEEKIKDSISSMFRWKGEKENEEELNTIPEDERTIGDVYNVKDTGANFVWNGSDWDKLSENITGLATKDELRETKSELQTEITTKVDAAKEELNTSIDSVSAELTAHTSDEQKHVSVEDRAKWNDVYSTSQVDEKLNTKVDKDQHQKDLDSVTKTASDALEAAKTELETTIEENKTAAETSDANLQKQITDNKTETDTKLTELETNKANKEYVDSELAKKVNNEDYQKDKTQLEENISTNASGVASNKEAIEALETKTDESNGKIDKLTSDLETANENISKNATDLQNHIDNTDVHFTNKEEKDALFADVEQAKKDIVSNKTDIEAKLDAAKTELSSEIDTKVDTAKSALETSINEVDTKLTEHTSDTAKHVSEEDRKKWDDTYSKSETDEKLSTKVDNTVYEKQVEDLEKEIATKANETTVTEIDGRVTTLEGEVKTLESTKATKEELATEVSTLNGAINKKADQTALDDHAKNTSLHIQEGERESWTAKVDTEQLNQAIEKAIEPLALQTEVDEIQKELQTKAKAVDLATHIDDTKKHVSADERTAWNSKAEKSDIDKAVATLEAEIATKVDQEAYDTEIQGIKDSVATKANQTDLEDHTTNTDIHVGEGERAKWDAKAETSHVDEKVATAKTELEATIGETDNKITDHIADDDKHVTPEQKETWSDKYTKQETDNKLALKADKTELESTKTQLQSEIKNAVTSMFKYKGEVATYSELEKEELQKEVGDVYNVEDSGANYVWNGTEWDKLSENISGLAQKTDLDEHIHNETVHFTGDEKSQMQSSITSLETTKAEKETVDEHIKDSTIHTSDEERNKWNAKAEVSDITSAVSELETKVDEKLETKVETSTYTEKVGEIEKQLATKAETTYVDERVNDAKTELNASITSVDTKLDEHIADEEKHISTEERNRWNNTYTKEETDVELAKKADKTTVEALDGRVTKLESIKVDQKYNAESANAQSGTAVAEAIKDFVTNTTFNSTVEGINTNISGVESTVTELEETVQTKASQDDLNAANTKITALETKTGELEETLKTKVDEETYNQKVADIEKTLGTKATQESLQTHIDNKEVHIQDGERDAWNAKAETTYVDTAVAEAKEALEKSITSIENTLSDKADKTTVEGIQSQVTSIDTRVTELEKVTVDQHYTADSTNAQSGTAVAEAIKDFVTESSMSTAISNVTTQVEELNTNLETLSNTVDGKAEQTEVDALTKTVEGKLDESKFNEQIKLYATVESVNALETTVGTKASQEDLDSLETTVSGKADKTELTDHINDKTVHVSKTERTQWNNAASKTELEAAKTQLQSDINTAVTSMFKYKGSVETAENLPSDSENNRVGDVYNVKDSDANYVWNGEEWDKLSENISGLAQKSELDAHIGNTTVHVTAEEKSGWDSKATQADIEAAVKDLATKESVSTLESKVEKKAEQADLTKHIEDTSVHFEEGEKQEIKDSIAEVESNLSTHTSNEDVHVTPEKKAEWDTKVDQDAVDASVGALRTEIEEQLETKADLSTVEELTNTVNEKLDKSEFETRIARFVTITYITEEERMNWNKPVVSVD